MNQRLKDRLDQVRRRWWIVLGVAVLATYAAVLPVLQMQPTYVARSLLIQSTPGLAPEQDAAMTVGYATVFNDPATIGRLKAATNTPEEVAVEARSVATSPILLIEATADDPEVAQEAAQSMATALRADVGEVRQAATRQPIQDAERELADLVAQPGPDGQLNPMVPVVQARLDTMLAAATNQLRELQLRAGVTKTETNIAVETGLRAVGGLLLGILAALGVATVSSRIGNSVDMRDKTDVEPLIEIPDGGSTKGSRLREERLRLLACRISLHDLPKSSVVCLSDCRGARGARDIAKALAGLSAQQGRRTVLVYADNEETPTIAGLGFNDALAECNSVQSLLRDSEAEPLKILPAGAPVVDRYALVSRERIDAVLDELRVVAEVIVIVASPIADTIDAQQICAASDLTVLVVGKGVSRAGDVDSAARALAGAHAVVAGGVLVDRRKFRR